MIFLYCQGSDLQLALLAFLQHGNHHTGQGKEGQGVGQDDEVIEHIRQLPNKVVAGKGAQEDEHQGNDGVDGVAELSGNCADSGEVALAPGTKGLVML